MNKFITLGAASAAMLLLGACDDGPFETDNGNGNGNGGLCMETSEGNEYPDIFPDWGVAPSSLAGAYDECEDYTGPIIITYFPDAQCSGGTWSFTFEHLGTSASAAIYMHDSAGNNSNQSLWWGERHPVTEGESDPNGWWERYELSLAFKDPASGAPTVGSQTWHTCAANNDSTIVFGVEVLDASGAVLDCMYFPLNNPAGHVEKFLTAYPSFSSCPDVDGWL